MQRIECRKFAEQQGWNIIKELCEKGVSGFKISADDRDAIQELREDAMNQRFDVLLVFMFASLGRRDDETPFGVEWCAKQGIRIFSVKEGEQKFESHTDSLINYIRYWQSEGESRKTSMRIKTRLDQMRGEGLYTGGTPRYGYRAVEKGRRNKKDKPVKDLEICHEEAAVVKEIFERTVYEGAGSFILATELSARGVRTHHGAKFNVSTVNIILRDRQYLGYLITQDITSPHLPELQIIDEALFNAAQEITEQRKTQNAAWRNIPRQNCSGVLLGGNLYCAACGKPVCTDETIEAVSALFAEKGSNAWFEMDAADILPKGFACPHCGKSAGFTKEEDTLDGWFDSGSTHFAAMKKDQGFWPATMYLEGLDQYRGWFQSSLLTAVGAFGEGAPFKECVTHGWTVDGEGRAMHKSLGNGVDPADIFNENGADILRLWAASADYHADVRCSKAIFQQLSQNYLKFRNTCKFMLDNLVDFDPTHLTKAEDMPVLDRWLITKLNELIE